MQIAGSTIKQSGNLKTVTIADPAANTELSVTVPAAKSWQLLLFSVQLVQGITQTPFPSLVFDDGTTILFRGPGCPAALNASLTFQVSWGVGLALTGGPTAAAPACTGPIPSGVILPAGYRIRTVTGGIGANTDYGAAQLLVIENGLT